VELARHIRTCSNEVRSVDRWAEVDIDDRIRVPIGRSSAAAILNVLPALVRRADTINEVLLRLVTVLQPYVPGLWRLSIRRFLSQEAQLELVAVWSASDTQLRPGTHLRRSIFDA
jgi:hypothetical protein